MKTRDKKYKISDLDTFKNEVLDELKNVEYNDLEDMVYRTGLTYSEVKKILDVKYIAPAYTGYTLTIGKYEIIDTDLMLKSLLPDEVKVENTNYDKD